MMCRIQPIDFDFSNFLVTFADLYYKKIMNTVAENNLSMIDLRKYNILHTMIAIKR